MISNIKFDIRYISKFRYYYFHIISDCWLFHLFDDCHIAVPTHSLEIALSLVHEMSQELLPFAHSQ